MIINFSGTRIRNFIVLPGQMFPRYAEVELTLRVTGARRNEFAYATVLFSEQRIYRQEPRPVNRLITK